MKYPVIVHKSEYGYDVSCPVYPAAIARVIRWRRRLKI